MSASGGFSNGSQMDALIAGGRMRRTSIRLARSRTVAS
jgi:hypothetical protein